MHLHCTRVIRSADTNTRTRSPHRPAHRTNLAISLCAGLLMLAGCGTEPTAPKAVDTPNAKVISNVLSATVVAVPPYIHTDIIGRRFIYGKASNASCCGKTRVTASLWQYYNGAWHRVAGPLTHESSLSPNEVIAPVFCGKPYTAYWFQTEAHGQTLWPDGWHTDPVRWSSLRSITC